MNNAFFHGYLLEDVYITQSLGFVHPNFLDHAYKLQKALYGLNQAPCAWYNELKFFILSVGFPNAQSNTSLFIYAHDGIIASLLVYVDDLILTINHSSFLTSFV